MSVDSGTSGRKRTSTAKARRKTQERRVSSRPSIPRRLTGTPRTDVLRLSPGAGIYLRGDNAVQFGLDATRAGVVLTERPIDLAVALSPARCGTTRSELIERLALADFSPTAAAGIVEDLVSFGVLTDCSSHGRVAVLGHTALAGDIANLLTASGFLVRRVITAGNPAKQLTAVPPAMLPVLVDQWAYSHALAPVLTDHFPASLTAASLDTRGLVGPLRVDGKGPCPVCMDLLRSDEDPYWAFVAAQTTLEWVSVPEAPPAASSEPSGTTGSAVAAGTASLADDRLSGAMPPDPAVRAATAAAAVAAVRTVYGIQSPPGESPTPPTPGTVTEINLYGPAPQRVVLPHRMCPVCNTASRQLKTKKAQRKNKAQKRKVSSAGSSPAGSE